MFLELHWARLPMHLLWTGPKTQRYHHLSQTPSLTSQLQGCYCVYCLEQPIPSNSHFMVWMCHSSRRTALQLLLPWKQRGGGGFPGKAEIPFKLGYFLGIWELWLSPWFELSSLHSNKHSLYCSCTLQVYNNIQISLNCRTLCRFGTYTWCLA